MTVPANIAPLRLRSKIERVLDRCVALKGRAALQTPVPDNPGVARGAGPPVNGLCNSAMERVHNGKGQHNVPEVTLAHAVCLTARLT